MNDVCTDGYFDGAGKSNLNHRKDSVALFTLSPS